MSPELAARIPGAPEFIAWFGRVPRFHDGSVLEFGLDLNRRGHLKVKTFRMNPDTDENGYFRLDRHCAVTFHFEEVAEADLAFEDAAEIIDSMTIKDHDGGFEMEINPINGFGALLRMKILRLAFEPDETQS